MKNFKNKQTRVLVATDIAARGIDINELSHVINFEIPNEPETYVHRIGRTGRAENSGIALSFCDREEQSYVRDIHKLIKKSIPVMDEHPYHIEHPSSTEKMPIETSQRGRGRSSGHRNRWRGRRQR